MIGWLSELEQLDIPDGAVPGLSKADKPTIKEKLLQLPADAAAQLLRGQQIDVLNKLCTLLPDTAAESAQCFTSFEEFEAFLVREGSTGVQQFARVVWQAGHQSCAAIAHSARMLSMQHGPDIRPLLNFCRLRSVMMSRRELLESTLRSPQPAISTRPSGLHPQEKPRPSHPKAVTAFDVVLDVQEYFEGLSPTPARVTPVDSTSFTLSAWVSAEEGLWESAVAEPANSLLQYEQYAREDHGNARINAQWRAQGYNTVTHSGLVSAQHKVRNDADSRGLKSGYNSDSDAPSPSSRTWLSGNPKQHLPVLTITS